MALLDLMRAIATADRRVITRLMTRASARQRVEVGASRAQAREYFLDELRHYVYAGDTALHVAAAAYDAAVARRLLAKGADVRARNRRGAEPLHYAVDGGPGAPHWSPRRQVAVIQRLLAAGADVDAADDSHVTPLHRAVRCRCAAAVEALLDAGADPRRKNGNGSTALDLATRTTGRGGSGSVEARAQQAEILRLLR